jgi:hypothetical protein
MNPMFKIKNEFCFSHDSLNNVFFLFSNSVYDIRFISTFKNIANFFFDWQAENIKNNAELKDCIFFLEELSPEENFQFILFMLHIKFLHRDNFASFLDNKYIKKSLTQEEKNTIIALDEFFYCFLSFYKELKIFSGLKEQFITFLLFQRNLRGISSLLNLTFKQSGFFYSWLNLNLKVLPITILLFLASHVTFPNIQGFFPFSLIFPGYHLIDFLVITLLISYISFIYIMLFLKELLYLYQAVFFIKNPWIFFIHIMKLPFIICLSILGITFCFLSLIKINPNIGFLSIMVFSNLRFLILFYLYPLLYQFFFPFHREIVNFFEKINNEKFVTNLRSGFNQETFLFHLRKTDDQYGYASSNFFICFVIFWFILIPSKIFNKIFISQKKRYNFEMAVPHGIEQTFQKKAYIRFYNSLRKIGRK